MLKLKKKLSDDQKGFASLEFILLMIFSIVILTSFLNILFFEYQRNSALNSLRDGARAGTRVVNLKNASAGQISDLKSECVTKAKEALNDLTNFTNPDVDCSVTFIPDNCNANPAVRPCSIGVTASLLSTPSNEDSVLLPWMQPWKNGRLSNLKETFVQRQAASNED